MKRTYATFKRESGTGKRKREEDEKEKEEEEGRIYISSAFAKSVDGNKGAVFTLNAGDVVQGTPGMLSLGSGDGEALALVLYGPRGSRVSDHGLCVPLVVSSPQKASKASKASRVVGTHVSPKVECDYDELNKCVHPCYFTPESELPDAIQSDLLPLTSLPPGLDWRFVAGVATAIQADIQFVRIVSCPAGYGAPIQHEDSCGPVCVTMIFGPDSTYRDIVVTI